LDNTNNSTIIGNIDKISSYENEGYIIKNNKRIFKQQINKKYSIDEIYMIYFIL